MSEAEEKPKGWPFNVATEYALCEASNVHGILTEVNKMLDAGWSVVGGISVSKDYIYYQAITKHVVKGE